MNARQAQAEGLSFTGVWEQSYDRKYAAEEAKKIRQKYKCRAVVVSEQGGVAVYADEKYFALQRLNDLEGGLRCIPFKRQKLLEQLAELDKEENDVAERIAKIQSEYGIGDQKGKDGE